MASVSNKATRWSERRRGQTGAKARDFEHPKGLRGSNVDSESARRQRISSILRASLCAAGLRADRTGNPNSSA
jgi:hypothetical protein